MIKNKFNKASQHGLTITLVWIPVHVGIPGNERTDALAKRIITVGESPTYGASHFDYYAQSKRTLDNKVVAALDPFLLQKGLVYGRFYVTTRYYKPWYYKKGLKRQEIVITN